MSKRLEIDWKRFEEIEFHARKVALQNPRLANASMVFLVDVVRTMQKRERSLLDKLAYIKKLNAAKVT